MTSLQSYINVFGAFGVLSFSILSGSSREQEVFVFTGNRLGFIESCGCNGELVKSSLAKERGYINSITKKYLAQGFKVTWVDLGNNFGDKNPSDYELITKAMNFDLSVDRRNKSYFVTKLGNNLSLYLCDSASNMQKLKAKPTDVLVKKIDGMETLCISGLQQFAPAAGAIILLKADAAHWILEKLKVPEDAEPDGIVAERISDYHRKQKESLLLGLAKIGSNKSETMECLSCHESSYRSWVISSHARSMHTLEINDSLTSECISCHSTAFKNNPKEFKVSTTPDNSVTCLSCHDVNGSHRADYKKAFKESIPESTCVNCHTPLNSKRFDFKKYKMRVHVSN
jgi:hypothetical protein